MKFLKMLMMIAAVVIGGWFLSGLLTSEESRILSRLDDLIDAAEYNRTPAPIEALGRAKTVGEFFSEPLKLTYRFQTPGGGGKSRSIVQKKRLQEVLIIAQRKIASADLDYNEPQVELHGNDQARVFLKGKVLGKVVRASEQFLEAHPLEIEMKKIDGEWMIVGAANLLDQDYQ